MAEATKIVDYYSVTFHASDSEVGKGRWGIFTERIYADNKTDARKHAKKSYPKCSILRIDAVMVYID